MFFQLIQFYLVKKQVKYEELEVIGFNIRKIRESQKMSRLQLAFEIGTTEKQIFRIEAGEINSGIMSFIKISRCLDVPLIRLFEKIE